MKVQQSVNAFSELFSYAENTEKIIENRTEEVYDLIPKGKLLFCDGRLLVAGKSYIVVCRKLIGSEIKDNRITQSRNEKINALHSGNGIAGIST